MSDLFEIKKGDDFVRSSYYGILTLPHLEEFIKEQVKKAEGWGFDSFYVDFRKTERSIGLYDDYQMAHLKAQKFGFKFGSRHALLVRDDHELKEWDFVATVFKNAGYVLRIFTDEEEALKWISDY